MSTNAVLAYLDSFQPRRGSKAERFFNIDLTQSESLEALLCAIKRKAAASSQDERHEAAKFFKPYALQHWQLNILLDTLRGKIREDIKKPEISEETKETLNAAIVLTTLLDVVSRDCMSNPYTDETINFGGCDFINLRPDEDPYKFYRYGYKLKNRTGIIQANNNQWYQVTLMNSELCNELLQVSVTEERRYKVTPFSSLNEAETMKSNKRLLGRACLSLTEGAARPADADELAWIKALTTCSRLENCELLHLPIEIRDPYDVTEIAEFVSKLYPEQAFQKSKHHFGVMLHNDKLYTLDYAIVDDMQGEWVVKRLSSPKNKIQLLGRACLSLTEGAARPANADELDWIKALTTHSHLENCELLHLPIEIRNPYDVTEIAEFVSKLYPEQAFQKSKHHFGVMLHNNRLYTLDYAIVDDMQGEWVVKRLSSPTDKIQQAFRGIVRGTSRPAIASEVIAITALSGRKCITNRQQELRTIFKNRLDIAIHDPEIPNYEPKPVTWVSWLCEGIQTFFIYCNDLRLGGLRWRRLSFFIGNFLVAFDFLNKYGLAWQFMHNWLENHGVLFIFSNLGWLFFLPRLMRNICILVYHLFCDSKLSSIEAAMDVTTRFRIHWMRFWDEVVNDSYWLLTGIAFRFLFYGVVSPMTVTINLLTQMADLLNAMIRAGLLIRRLYNLEQGLETHQMSMSLHAHLRKRINLEQKFLLYRVFHFVVLLVAMCMTLPSAAAISPLFPVVGAFCAVVMTIVTLKIQANFREIQNNFKKESLELDIPELDERGMRLNNMSVWG